jgi:hypothetical protein
MGTRYDRMVEAAAERAADTGIVDLVDLTEAAEAGFNTTAFANEVAQLADLIDYVR